MYVYVYVYMYIHIHIHIIVYVYVYVLSVVCIYHSTHAYHTIVYMRTPRCRRCKVTSSKVTKYDSKRHLFRLYVYPVQGSERGVLSTRFRVWGLGLGFRV